MLRSPTEIKSDLNFNARYFNSVSVSFSSQVCERGLSNVQQTSSFLPFELMGNPLALLYLLLEMFETKSTLKRDWETMRHKQ